MQLAYPSSNMGTMDEYIKQILAEIPEKNSTLHNVVQNILDEPIPDSVKGRLLKPLQPGKYRRSPAPRKKKAAKRKAIEEEFDPISSNKVLRSVKEYQDEILDLIASAKQIKEKLVFSQTPWVIGDLLRGWQMNVPAIVQTPELSSRLWCPKSVASSRKRSRFWVACSTPASEGQPRR
ncbi:MAG: hypothetical protein AB2556_16060 [Candidatus Thiodiazotropha sp.]